MERERVPWVAPLVEPPIGAGGHLPTRDKNEADGTWWDWAPGVRETGGRHGHTVVQVRAASLRPPEPPGACQHMPRRVRGRDGKIGDAG